MKMRITHYLGFFTCMFLSANASALQNDIKLECQLSSSWMHRGGGKETKIENVIVEIKFIGKDIFISAASKIFSTSISTRPDSSSEVIDDSDETKFSIDRAKKGSEGKGNSEYILIDRATGVLHWEKVSGASTISNSDGKCRKVDSQNKLF